MRSPRPLPPAAKALVLVALAALQLLQLLSGPGAPTRVKAADFEHQVEANAAQRSRLRTEVVHRLDSESLDRGKGETPERCRNIRVSWCKISSSSSTCANLGCGCQERPVRLPPPQPQNVFIFSVLDDGRDCHMECSQVQDPVTQETYSLLQCMGYY